MRRDEHARRNGALIADTWDSDIVSELAPQRNDLVIMKNRYDAFRSTSLDEELRLRGVTELLVAGVLTNVCVETTARAGYDRDYHVIMIEDCTAARTLDLHRNAINGLTKSKLASAMTCHDATTSHGNQ